MLAWDRRKGALALGLLLILGGVPSLSRVHVVLAAVVTGYLLRHKPWLVGLLLVALATLVVTRSHGPQGLLRDPHFERRAVGAQVTLRTLAEKPLQGVGWGRYERAVQRFGPPVTRLKPYSTPDNTYARVLAEGGGIGGGAWLVWLGAAVLGLRRRSSWIPPLLPALCLVAMWAVFDGAYWPAATVTPMMAVGLISGADLRDRN